MSVVVVTPSFPSLPQDLRFEKKQIFLQSVNDFAFVYQIWLLSVNKGLIGVFLIKKRGVYYFHHHIQSSLIIPFFGDDDLPHHESVDTSWTRLLKTVGA